MQSRSIIAVFIVICLIVATFFSNVAEGGKVLDNTNQNSNFPNKNNLFVQRMRRNALNTNRRYKRQDGNSGGDGGFDQRNNAPTNFDAGNNAGGGYQPSQYGDQGQQNSIQNPSGDDQN